MERFWLKSYPPGVPADIDVKALRSVKDLAQLSFAQHAPHPAFSQMGRTLSFRDVDTLSRAFAAWLQHVGGLERGDRIAIMLPNVLQYPVALLGALRAGLAVVNTNPLYTARELEHQLRDCGAKAVVVLENFAHVVAEVLPRTQVTRVLTTAAGDWLGFPKSWIVNAVVRRRAPPEARRRIGVAYDF